MTAVHSTRTLLLLTDEARGGWTAHPVRCPSLGDGHHHFVRPVSPDTATIDSPAPGTRM